jgi:hypothetical protein
MELGPPLELMADTRAGPMIWEKLALGTVI